jgi:phosphatidylglycerophosphate synthase
MDQPQTSTKTPHTLLATLPNALCWFRLAGSVVLIAVAVADQWRAAWFLLPLLLLSDWIDGRIARHFSIETRHGALLDTVADVAMGSAIVIATLYYSPTLLRTYWPWITAAAGSYVMHLALCLAKFRRWPSYHTRLAKAGWLLVLLALAGVVSRQAEWFVVVAAITVIVTNAEAILITLLLPAYRVNIPSVFHLLN